MVKGIWKSPNKTFDFNQFFSAYFTHRDLKPRGGDFFLGEEPSNISLLSQSRVICRYTSLGCPIHVEWDSTLAPNRSATRLELILSG